MSKAIVTRFIFPLFLLFAWFEADGGTAAAQKQSSPNNQNVNGTLQKMIVENGSVTLDLDLNGLNGSNSLASKTGHIAIRRCEPIRSFPFSFLTICCAAPSRARWPCSARPSRIPCFPAALAASLKQLVVEKTSFRRGVRPRRARRQDGIHLFQRRRTPIRLRPCAQSLSITRRKSSHFKRVCQRARPPIGCRCDRWQDLDRRGDATDRDHTSSLTAKPNPS